MEKPVSDPSGPSANRALLGGIAFSFLFTALIWLLGPRLNDVRLLPDQGAAWYYWKLPEATVWTRLSAWLPYLLHQVIIWWLIYRAQVQRPGYTNGLHWFNVWALGVNAAFILLHLIQTHVFYDGLAQDVSVFSSQGSVILLLVMVILMESRRRGLLFGRSAGVPDSAIGVVKRYHGYVFAWATIYTFWFHPTVSTPGHLIGFIYMFLLLVQGSLFFTRAHLNRAWTTSLEVAVLVHGALVAYGQGKGLWPMFAFGFGAIFIATQMYGLGWPRWARWTAIAAFVALVTLVYSGRGWDKLNEVIRIPVIEYVLVFILAWLIAGGHWLWRRLRPAGAASTA
ncbi:hypothetical protein [Deinococcus sedimenti]|uniref:Serine active site containing 1-like protein n=1 Tax=Deinococcus sedimenti TaxID=1867090 RepID=A0ABQ2RZ43_9DEIO|nr:hypothetical protein [Deinococcus sedimenti]GGR82515.1 hypothetical protein GCM10008960_06890 [Deinococcus sedimenti]